MNCIDFLRRKMRILSEVLQEKASPEGIPNQGNTLIESQFLLHESFKYELPFFIFCIRFIRHLEHIDVSLFYELFCEVLFP
jgi:hypothetical protein